MAVTTRHNITTALTQDLIAAGDGRYTVKSIILANVHASSTVNVDLFINNSSKDYYIIKNMSIPSGVTLVVDTSGFQLDTSAGNDSLRIKLSAAIPVDVALNR